MLQYRKTIRLDHLIYKAIDQPFSITICTYDHRPIFKNESHASPIFNSILNGRLRNDADLMAVCLMPDHLHLLIAPITINLIKLVGAWKSFSSNLLPKLGHQGKVWQRSFYDHTLRNDEHIEFVANYIVNNPVRAGIVEQWRDYPYSWHRWM